MSHYPNFLKKGVFDIQNIITIPTAKLVRKLGTLNSNQMDQIETIIKVWLGLN